MHLHQIARITGARFKNLADKKVNRFIIDSRRAKEGDLFVPLKGNNVDGHQFIDEVLQKGAAGSFSSKNIGKDNVLIVEDTLKALTDVAKFKKDFIKTKIGITGTAGKTTTKEILSYLLSYFYPVYYTKGNYNNQIGLPLTLANIDKEYKYGVFELGASRKGDISYLTDILNQDVAVITNVGYGHTEGLGGFEGVLEEKKNILKYAKFKIVPKWLNLKDKNIKTFGYENADINIIDVKLSKNGTEGFLEYKGKQYKVSIPVFNKKILENIAISILIMDYLDIDFEKALKTLREFTLLEGRGRIIKHKNLTIIDDTYNANPTSVKVAIETLSALKGNKILILADMKELGKYSKEKHEEIGKYILNSTIDKVYLYGEEVKYTYEVIKSKKESHLLSKEEIAFRLKKEKEPCFVWIKGSRSMKMEEVIQLLI